MTQHNVAQPSNKEQDRADLTTHLLSAFQGDAATHLVLDVGQSSEELFLQVDAVASGDKTI